MARRLISGRIRLSSIIVFSFTIILLLDYHFFYLIDYWNVLKGNSMCLIVAILGIISASFIVKIKGGVVGREIKWAYRVSWLSFVVWFMVCFYSTIIYPKQPVVYTVVEHVSLLYMFWTIPLFYCFVKEHKAAILFNIINVVCFIWYVLLLIQFVEWIKGRNLIFVDGGLSVIKTRGFGIRIGLGSLGNINLLYNSNMLFNAKSKKKKALHCLMMALGLFCMIFVQQTRSFTAIVICCIAFNMILSSKQISKKIFAVFVLLVFLAALIYSGVFLDFLLSFSVMGVEGKGTTIRLEETKYYLECFLHNPVFGNGFTNYQYYPLVQYKAYQPYSYYYTDIGIIGLLAEIGLGAIIVYVLPMKRAFEIGVKAYKYNRQEFAMYITYLVYFCMTSFTLIATDSARAISYPFFLAFALYVEYVVERKNAMN